MAEWKSFMPVLFDAVTVQGHRRVSRAEETSSRTRGSRMTQSSTLEQQQSVAKGIEGLDGCQTAQTICIYATSRPDTGACWGYVGNARHIMTRP